jgi:hypothetical protein
VQGICNLLFCLLYSRNRLTWHFDYSWLLDLRETCRIFHVFGALSGSCRSLLALLLALSIHLILKRVYWPGLIRYTNSQSVKVMTQIGTWVQVSH